MRIAATMAGTDRRFQVINGIRVAMKAPMTPKTADSSWVKKTV
jgi:hypothetical protein